MSSHHNDYLEQQQEMLEEEEHVNKPIWSQQQLQDAVNETYERHAFDMFISCTCIGLACLLMGYMLGVLYPIV